MPLLLTGISLGISMIEFNNTLLSDNFLHRFAAPKLPQSSALANKK